MTLPHMDKNLRRDEVTETSLATPYPLPRADHSNIHSSNYALIKTFIFRYNQQTTTMSNLFRAAPIGRPVVNNPNYLDFMDWIEDQPTEGEWPFPRPTSLRVDLYNVLDARANNIKTYATIEWRSQRQSEHITISGYFTDIRRSSYELPGDVRNLTKQQTDNWKRLLSNHINERWRYFNGPAQEKAQTYEQRKKLKESLQSLMSFIRNHFPRRATWQKWYTIQTQQPKPDETFSEGYTLTVHLKRSDSHYQCSLSLKVGPETKPIDLIEFRGQIEAILNTDNLSEATLHYRVHFIEEFRNWVKALEPLTPTEKISTILNPATAKRRCRMNIIISHNKCWDSHTLAEIKVTNNDLTPTVMDEWKKTTMNAIHRYQKKCEKDYLQPPRNRRLKDDEESESEPEDGWPRNKREIRKLPTRGFYPDTSDSSEEEDEEDTPQEDVDTLAERLTREQSEANRTQSIPLPEPVDLNNNSQHIEENQVSEQETSQNTDQEMASTEETIQDLNQNQASEQETSSNKDQEMASTEETNQNLKQNQASEQETSQKNKESKVSTMETNQTQDQEHETASNPETSPNTAQANIQDMEYNDDTMMEFDIEPDDMIINGVRYHIANKDDPEDIVYNFTINGKKYEAAIDRKLRKQNIKSPKSGLEKEIETRPLEEGPTEEMASSTETNPKDSNCQKASEMRLDSESQKATIGDLLRNPDKEFQVQIEEGGELWFSIESKNILVNGTIMTPMESQPKDKRLLRSTISIDGTTYQKHKHKDLQDVIINGHILQRPTEAPESQNTLWVNDEVFLMPEGLGPIKTVEIPEHQPKKQHVITTMDQSQKERLLLQRDRMFRQHTKGKHPSELVEVLLEEKPTYKRSQEKEKDEDGTCPGPKRTRTSLEADQPPSESATNLPHQPLLCRDRLVPTTTDIPHLYTKEIEKSKPTNEEEDKTPPKAESQPPVQTSIKENRQAAKEEHIFKKPQLQPKRLFQGPQVVPKHLVENNTKTDAPKSPQPITIKLLKTGFNDKGKPVFQTIQKDQSPSTDQPTQMEDTAAKRPSLLDLANAAEKAKEKDYELGKRDYLTANETATQEGEKILHNAVSIMMTKPEGSPEYEKAKKDIKTELTRRNGQENTNRNQIQTYYIYTSTIRKIAHQLITLPHMSNQEQMKTLLARAKENKELQERLEAQRKDIASILKPDITLEEIEEIKDRHSMRAFNTPGCTYLETLILRKRLGKISEQTRLSHNYMEALKREVHPSRLGYRKENRTAKEREKDITRIEIAIDAMMDHHKRQKDAITDKLIFQLEKLEEDGTLTSETAFHLQQYAQDKRDGIQSRPEEEMERIRKEDRDQRLSDYNLMIMKAAVKKIRTAKNLSTDRLVDKEEYEAEEQELNKYINETIRPISGEDINTEIRFKQLIARTFYQGIIKIEHIQDFVKELVLRMSSGQPILELLNAYGEKTKRTFNSGMPLETIV